MNKPKEPSKEITITESKQLTFYYCSNKIALSTFTDWCKEIIPPNAFDVTLELIEGCHEPYVANYESTLEVAWKINKSNHLYEKQMESYRKKMIKWQKQQSK